MRRARVQQALVAVAVMVIGVTIVATSMLGLDRTETARSKHAIPSWVQWQTRLFNADLDNDGIPETVSLQNRSLSITDGREDTTASLPDGRLTSEVLVQDIDFDGTQEIVTLTWKQGSFGPYRPFWHDKADDAMTEHVFIFTYENGALKDKWLSSDVRIEIADLKVDSFGRLRATLYDGSEEVLEWQGWGLTYLDEATSSWNQELFDTATISVMGDVIAHDAILNQAQQHATESGEYNFSFLFKNIAPYVESVDIAIVNQEGPLVRDERQVNGSSYSFGAPASMAQAYKEAGFDVIALANNHIMDRGPSGFLETIEVIRESGLVSTGYEPTIIECNNMRIGIVNATYLQIAEDSTLTPDSAINYLDESFVAIGEQVTDQSAVVDGRLATVSQDAQHQQVPRVQTTVSPSVLQTDMASLRDTTDFVLCFLHIGEEYATEPTEEDKMLIESLIDAGADAVVCAHPHVVQPVERITTTQGNTGVVFYSLGNLVSSQIEPGTQSGLIAQFVIAKSKEDPSARAQIVTYQAIPTTCVMTPEETTVFIQ